MSSLNGLPLLSGPPPQSEASEACRKCNKEFNVLFVRSRKCNHCGYMYCQPCSDYQALMPRTGSGSGYDSMHVCAYCIELLSITAAGVSQLRSMSPGKLKSYAEAYNIDISRAVEKTEIVDAIVRARQPNGCLSRTKEDYYRRSKVPNPYAGSRPRGIFSRNDPPPPVPPRTRPGSAPSFPRPDLGQSHPQPPQSPQPQPPQPPQPPRFPQPQPQPQPQAQTQSPPYTHYHHPYGTPGTPPPSWNYGHNHPTSNYQWSPNYHQQQHYNIPPYHPPFNQSHPPPPPPQETRPSTSYPQANTSNASHRPPTQQPPPPPSSTRPPSTHNQPQVPTPPPPATPMPTLDQLLVMTKQNISTLSISVLKSILSTNHVNASMVLEKSELVKKVLELIEDENKERERQRIIEEAERIDEEERKREREEAIKREEEERRMRAEDRARQERRERYRATMEEVDDDDSVQEYEIEAESDSSKSDVNNRDGGVPPPDSNSSPGTPPKASSSSTHSHFLPSLERSGLCVICQDDEANIAIVDCGHLAMCRTCSELVMSSSRECPLCRTRIVTDARLLRIFKS